MSHPDPQFDDWIICEVCGEEFSSYGNEGGNKRCDECTEEWGDVLWPDQV